VSFLRFFIEGKLPGVGMMTLRTSGWEFIVKAIESLDISLGVRYTLTPMPLLWRIVREAYMVRDSYMFAGHAIKLMTARLLKVRFFDA
jgi:hypothetical protein